MIYLRGPFLWIWGTWHVLWLGGLIWTAVAVRAGVDPLWIAFFWATLYTVFLPPEIIGARLNALRKDGVARTLSEFRQFLPVTYGKGPNGIGWKALGGFSALIDATVVGWLAWHVSPITGAVASVITWLTLAPHYGWRWLVGTFVTFLNPSTGPWA